MLNRHTAELLARSSFYMFLLVFIVNLPYAILSVFVPMPSIGLFVGLFELVLMLAGVVFGITALYHMRFYGCGKILGWALAGTFLCLLPLIPLLLLIMRNLP